MTPDTQRATQALLPVTEEDRQVAAPFANCLRDMQDIFDGKADGLPVVQAFARHRISHSLPGDVGLRNALLDAKNALTGFSLHPSDRKRAIAAIDAALTPSALSGDAGEVETTVAAIVAHLRTRADGFRAAAKKQGKRVGPMAKGFDWAALEIESTFAALPSHKGAGE